MLPSFCLSSTAVFLYSAGLLEGIDNEKLSIKFIEMCEKYSDNHRILFVDEFFDQSLTHSKSYIRRDLIYPSIRRIFDKFYLNPPTIFINSYDGVSRNHNSNPDRLKLFQEIFNLEEFLVHLRDKLMKNIDCLNDFPNLDSEVEILHLIVSDYLASKVDHVLNFYGSINKELRDLRINKIL